MSYSILEKSIFKTLLYADLFSWPMKLEEIQKYLVGKKTDKTTLLRTVLKKLCKSGKIEIFKNYYFFSGSWSGKRNSVELRLQKERWAREKMVLAKKRAEWLKIIPFVLLVGVSGGLAVGNVDKEDDIDFFIICRKGTLWTTRFLVTSLFDIFGWRRRPAFAKASAGRPADKNIKDKICLNMFVDEEGMAVPEKERDLFIAHEVEQMKPLWDKGVYESFLEANRWMVDYLPNSKLPSCHSDQAQPGARRYLAQPEKNLGRRPHEFTLARSFPRIICGVRMTGWAEKFLCWLQLQIMAGRRTGEKIEPHRLLFHPKDKRKVVMKIYKQKIKKLKP